MALYVLTIIVGLLGLAALALVFLPRLRPPHPVELDMAQSLTFLSPCTQGETLPSMSSSKWWPRVLTGRHARLTQDSCFLYRIAQFVNEASSLNHTLQYAMRELTRHLAMDMGRVFLLDDDEMLQLAVSVGSCVHSSPMPDWEFTLPNLALAADKPLIISDLRQWPQLRSFISATELASALWLPLKTAGRAVGALGLGSRRPNVFDQDTVIIISTVASCLATIVENFGLRRQVGQEKELRQTLQRYVSPRLVTIFQQGSAPHPQEIIDASGRMSVLFADVRNFTPLMEKADPNAVMQVLNEYFLRMSQIIKANSGVVDEFAGDQIVASFDRTSPRVNDAYRAVRAGVEMLNGLEMLQKRWRDRGLPNFDIGIGISTGAVTRGSIGSKERRALIALGSILNIASRAEGMNKAFGTTLIITQSTFDQVSDLVECEALGAHELQGISEPVPLYSVRGLKSNNLEAKTSDDTYRIAQTTQRRQALTEPVNPDVGAGLFA